MRPTGKSPKPGFPETSSVPVFPFSFRTTSERQTTSGSSSSPATSICFSNLRTNCFERSVRIWPIPGKRMSRFLVISSERLRTFDPSWARSMTRRPRRTLPRWKFATTSWDKRSRQSYLEKRLYLRIFNFELNLFWSHLYCFFYAANKKKPLKCFCDLCSKNWISKTNDSASAAFSKTCFAASGEKLKSGSKRPSSLVRARSLWS